MRGEKGRYALLGVSNNRISLLLKGTMKAGSRVPAAVLRLKNTIIVLIQHQVDQRSGSDVLMEYSFKFPGVSTMAVETKVSSHTSPYVNQVTSMVCREYESGQLGDFVAHCVVEYLNLGGFYMRLKEGIDEPPVYLNRLLEGEPSPLLLEIMRNPTEAENAHYWDLNDDLIVKVKFGQTREEETGIKVWEVRDHTNHSLEDHWPTKYNDQLPRMGFSTQVALVRSLNDYSQISMFFNRATQLWDNTIIRYDIDSHDILSIPDLDYADLNLNVMAMRFVYGDGSSTKSVPLNQLVRIVKVDEQGDDSNTLFLALLIIFTGFFSLILGLLTYYLCLKRKVKKLIENERKEEERTNVLVIQGVKSEGLEYTSLDASIGESLGDLGAEDAAIELK